MNHFQYKDYTIKARIIDVAKIEAALNSLGATCMGTDTQTDHYFQTERGKLKWRQGTIENLITHYERQPEPDIERTIVYRYDVNPGKEEIEVLKQSHRQIGVIVKQRTIYLLNHLKIHLDKFEDSYFLEIEAIDRFDKFSEPELKQQCLQMQALLGIEDQHRVLTGYLPTNQL